MQHHNITSIPAAISLLQSCLGRLAECRSIYWTSLKQSNYDTRASISKSPDQPRLCLSSTILTPKYQWELATARCQLIQKVNAEGSRRTGGSPATCHHGDSTGKTNSSTRNMLMSTTQNTHIQHNTLLSASVAQADSQEPRAWRLRVPFAEKCHPGTEKSKSQLWLS